jgi:myo-inositol 2-dehydrogenase / D-chiro-inositol 1-dehydrogenase
MMSRRIGVGIIGGGLAAQAIHLPTLARMPDRFRVVRVMDADLATAKVVAARCGAQASASANEVYDDPAVEVVAICSPHALHAEQAIAACRAGKRLIICEKPLGTTRAEAQGLALAAEESKTPIIVGAMHVYDPAYRDAHAAWTEMGNEAVHVHSAIYLPSNDLFIDQATDRAPRASAPPPARPNLADPIVQAQLIRGAILGLAIHDLPLVRAFQPEIGAIMSARYVPPFGYELSTMSEGRTARFLAFMPGEWPPSWTLRAIGRACELRATFPPSYVLSGSSRCEVFERGRTLVFEHCAGGYEEMWAHGFDVVSELSAPLVGLDGIMADIAYAMTLADRVDEFLRTNK